jgi:hypothetical protein
MLSYKSEFTNYLGQPVHLVLESWLHINEKHPEITIEIIQMTIKDPDVVLLSEMNPDSELYFLQKNLLESVIRFSVVIVKIKDDGLWISTAMTRKKVTGGIEIFRRKK